MDTLSTLFQVFIIPSFYLTWGIIFFYCLDSYVNETKGINFLIGFKYFGYTGYKKLMIREKLENRNMKRGAIGLISIGFLFESIYSQNLILAGVFLIGVMITWMNEKSGIEDVILTYGEYLLIDKIEAENPDLLKKYKKHGRDSYDKDGVKGTEGRAD